MNLNSIAHFRADPDKVLNQLQGLTGYTLNNEQRQKAKLLGLTVASRQIPTLPALFMVWYYDSILKGFATAVGHKLIISVDV